MSEDLTLDEAVKVWADSDKTGGSSGHAMMPYSNGWLHLIYLNGVVIDRYFEPWENDDDG